MELTVIRHTKVHNPEKLCYGHFDIALDLAVFNTEKERIKNILNKTRFDAVYSSPINRCKLLAEHCFPKVITDNRLKELDFGNWEGKPRNSIAAETNEFFSNYNFHKSCPNGESFFDLTLRVSSFINEIYSKYNNNSKIAIFTHSGPIKAFMSEINNMPPVKTFDTTINYGDIVHFSLTL